jgi:flagellar biosynthesis/type III secretory pathway protein FliH
MSERTPHTPHEQFEITAEHAPDTDKEAEKKRHEQLEEHEHNKQEKIEQIRTTADKEAKSTEQMLDEASREPSSQENEPAFINYEIKEVAYQRLLKRTRGHLSPYARTMSKIIHQPAVDAASEVVSKTVGRPSGIIGGGLTALLGTSVYYYLTKHFGYTYNPFVFLVLMFVGFIIGWIAEIVYESLKAASKK